MPIRLATAILAVVLAALVAACGEAKIKQSELEDKVKTALTEKVGQEPKEIQCPGDISANVGTKTRCTLVASDNSKLDVDVRVASRDGDQYRLAIMAGTKVRR